MTIEQLSDEIRQRHNIRSLHIFAREEGWRVFAARGDAKFQASVEEGRGDTIHAALTNLNERLVAGPINRGELPPWGAAQ